MTTLIERQQQRLLAVESRTNGFYTTGAVAAGLQLLVILVAGVATVILGPRPTSAEEYYALQESSRLAVILRGNFPLMLLVALYLGTFPALFVALRRVNGVATTLATLFIFIGVAIGFANEPTFSLLHLGDKFAAATSAAQRAQLLAAGEAALALGWWHSSNAYMSGILLQGAGVIISIVMLRSGDFSKVTAYAGLLGNGLDLLQHLAHPFAPAFSESVMPLMGVFYLVWFPMLVRDFMRLRATEEAL